MSTLRNQQAARRTAKTAIIASLVQSSSAAMRADMAQAAAEGADLIECRLDFLTRCGREDIAELLAGRLLPVILTCRPVRQGGRFAGREEDRLELLRLAAQLGADYVDIEMDVPQSRWPAGNIIVSHHDFQRKPANLSTIVSRLATTRAAVIKVAFAAAGPEDAIAALDVLRTAGKLAISLAMGEAGMASRVLARKFGAFGSYASMVPGMQSAHGQLTIRQMKRLYRWDSIGPSTAVYGVVGHPLGHSLSPLAHNAALEAAGLDGVYLPLVVPPGPEAFERFTASVAQSPWLDLRGLSVTIPHKQNALAHVGSGSADPLAVRIGAVNTISFGPSGPAGWNTDYAGAIDALCEAMGIARAGLAGERVAVLGAGGAARAIVAGLADCGAQITVYNRTLNRAEELAVAFGCAAAPLEAAGDSDAAIIINCTSIGMWPDVDKTPLPTVPPAAKVVFDTIYNPLRTRLLESAARAGCRTISGLEMFVNQAAQQFMLWTGQRAPKDVMRQAVLEELAGT